MKHLLPPLPYSKNALEPFMSAQTLEYHHGKHHKAYVDKLNELIPGTPHENQTLDEIVKSSSGTIFNNAAQAWNHNFFWKCLSNGESRISNDLVDIFIKTYSKFRCRNSRNVF